MNPARPLPPARPAAPASNVDTSTVDRTRLWAPLALWLPLAGCAGSPSPGVPTAAAPTPALDLLAAGPGSGFLPYAEGLAAWIARADAAPVRTLRVQAVASRGSIDNLQQVDADPRKIGLAFLGTVHEALQGSAAWTQGRRFTNLRALTPMYETSFQLVALKRSGLSRVAALQGKRVGVGPAGGPAEGFFQGLQVAVGLTAERVHGQPAELVEALLQGRIDALWQGASPPIPALRTVLERAESQVFGLEETEVAAMRQRFPFLAEATVAPGTYPGQVLPIRSVAAWNFVIAHRDLPEAVAYAFTRQVLSSSDPAREIHASAGPTRAANARANTVLPFHPGALRRYRELGIQGLPSA